MPNLRQTRVLVPSLLITTLMALSIACCRPSLAADGPAASDHFGDGRFHNLAPTTQPGFGGTLKIVWRLMTDKPADAAPARPIQVLPLTQADLLAAPGASLWRLGHSTMLLKLDGKFWLTDPVFSERASPVGFAGPKRFHAPPIALENLPDIEAVILSHDHYDHLDHDAVLALAPKVRRFLAPLGVGDRLVEWGVPAAKVEQFDWWQGVTIGNVQLVATPAQHFSGRGLTDRDRTLWASWTVIAPEARVFFSGDGGYFDGFKAIGDRFGPFDLAMVETGAYDKAWPDVHMQPEQSLQAHLDLRGRQMMPIHNGTFDLALHPWTEPFERILALAAEKGVSVSTPRMGERLDLLAPAAGQAWWR
nr:MBL fold metallo-hydrolase [Rhizobacter sp. Root1221]